MYKKAWCTCKIVVLLIKPIAFVAFPLPSPPSDLKLPTYIIWKRIFKGRRTIRMIGVLAIAKLSSFIGWFPYDHLDLSNRPKKSTWSKRCRRCADNNIRLEQNMGSAPSFMLYFGLIPWDPQSRFHGNSYSRPWSVKRANSARAPDFLFIFLSSLHDYDMTFHVLWRIFFFCTWIWTLRIPLQ